MRASRRKGRPGCPTIPRCAVGRQDRQAVGRRPQTCQQFRREGSGGHRTSCPERSRWRAAGNQPAPRSPHRGRSLRAVRVLFLCPTPTPDEQWAMSGPNCIHVNAILAGAGTNVQTGPSVEAWCCASRAAGKSEGPPDVGGRQGRQPGPLLRGGRRLLPCRVGAPDDSPYAGTRWPGWRSSSGQTVAPIGLIDIGVSVFRALPTSACARMLMLRPAAGPCRTGSIASVQCRVRHCTCCPCRKQTSCVLGSFPFLLGP
jgi:hypothetical protein